MDALQETLLRLVDWRAVFEIALIAAALYVLYGSLRAMGAWKIALGILSFLALFLLARALELRGLEWILSRFSGVALIGLIVLFQPEIRRILERAMSFRHGVTPEGRPQESSLLADVLFDLGGRRRGALLVLPGLESLESWTSSGIPLDAKPSFPLLASLFDPGSPGHDGAVILHQGRLTSFGVRLPLSGHGDLPGDLGTRHHAALGLSEVTDALVIAVSEERGTVSVFADGAMRPIDSREQLVESVREHWRRATVRAPARRSRGLRRLLNAPLAGSVMLAALFWLAIVPRQGETLEMSFPVLLEYAGTPAHLALVGPRIDRARVLLSGTTTELSQVDPTSLRLRVDLSVVEAGRQQLPVLLAGLQLPAGVNVADIEPSSIELEVVPLVERDWPVRAQLVGTPADGSTVGKTEIRPRTVRVLVPETAGSEGEILTAPIQLATLSGSSRIVSRVVPPAGVRPAGGNWPDVTVSLTLLVPDAE